MACLWCSWNGGQARFKALMRSPASPAVRWQGSVLDNIRQWRSLSRVHFIETQVFTKQITSLLDEAEYRQLQVTLALKPRAGDIIRGSGGLRKIRWSVRGRGKSGGIRVIYYLVADEEIYFLFAYAKNQQEDLDSGQLRILRNLVKEEFK
jgi:mRNA-degrading endonuclease RelE of RelBE toxin-antitoxin system